MPEPHIPTAGAEQTLPPDAIDSTQPHEGRGVLATAWNALVGGIMGLLPHLLHHVGL